MGKILEINLSNDSIKEVPLNEDLAIKFLGGVGYATATLFPLLSKELNPLEPDNPLMFMTGPLLGSPVICTGKMIGCTKSPITGLLAQSAIGSHINLQVKKAGYDGILIKGAASSAIFIDIFDDKVEILDASNIWGKGIYDTHAILKSEGERKNAKIMAIGPAGENLVKYAIIGSEERAFGRLGLGAVMGSKKIKAIRIKGTKKIEFAEPEKLRALAKEVSDEVMEIYTNQVIGGLGTSANCNLYALMGELPVKYYRSSDFPEVDNISGATLAETYLKRQRHCYACPIGCGRGIEVGKNDEGLPEGEFEGPEYETIAGFGSLMNNSNLLSIIKANYLCNDYGLDTISASSVIAFLMDLFDQGRINESDIDGLKLQWADMEKVFILLGKIAYRKGIGDILAEGTNYVGEKFKIDKEQIATVMNNDVPYHDARSSFGMAIAYAISPNYGASHCACDAFMTSLGAAYEEYGIESVPAQENSKEMAIMSARLMAYRAFSSSLVQCTFGNPLKTSKLAKEIELAIGIPFDLEAAKILGERVLNLIRLTNLKLGLEPSNEKLPKILLKPLEGGTNGKVPDTELLFSEFYKYNQWDPKTGMPSMEKIEKLGLKDYAKF